jgi:hypothetical protein
VRVIEPGIIDTSRAQRIGVATPAPRYPSRE